jgi:hypothetical protein
VLIIRPRSLTGLPIQGALIPQDGGKFARLIVFSGVSVMVGAVLICGSRMLRVGWHAKG